MAEQTDGGSVKRYLRGINLLAGEADGMVYYYILNEHGDVTQLWGQSGACKASYEYDAFGNEWEPEKGDENSFRYCGEYLDLETSTYYLRARIYRPETGRFTSEDVARAGTNWYTYCENDPVNRIDPWGLDSYVFYDPNDSGIKPYVTKEKAKHLAAEMAAFYGTDVHLVAIASGTYTIDGNDIDMSAADYFEYQWNLMGDLGTGTIEGVGLYFHGNWDASGLPFKLEGGGKNDWDMPSFQDVSKLNVKTMDTLFILACTQGKGETNFASKMTDRMNLNYTIASDGKTLVTNVFGTNHYSSRLNPYGLVVYKKHYPSESDVFWQSKPQVTKSRLKNDTLFSNYAGFVSLMRAAGIPKP